MKYNRLKTMAFALVLVLPLALVTACGNGGEESEGDGGARILVFAHVLDTRHPVHQGAIKMDEVLQELSGGTMKLDVFPDSALGTEEDCISMMQTGTIDISAPSSAPLQSLCPAFLTCDFPFALNHYDEVWNFYDGEYGEFLFQQLEGTGLMGLAWWDNGFRNLTTTKTPINSVEDLKGLKIRTMSARVHMASFNAMGAAATPIPWAEVYSGLQQGVVDGQENPVANISGGKIYEVQKYLITTRHFHDVTPLVISESTWNSLNSDEQGWLKEAAEVGTEYMRNLSEDNEQSLVDELAEKGMTVITLEERAIKGFQDAAAGVMDEFAAEIGVETLTLYQRCIEEARN